VGRQQGKCDFAPDSGSNFPGGKMPDVHISWLEGRTVEQKRKVVKRITQVLMEEAGIKPEFNHIVFADIPATCFASGGMLISDKSKKS
jgi:4-oxalocrotonate tautomerase